MYRYLMVPDTRRLLLKSRMHLHLFTTAVVYLTTSAINFDPAELLRRYRAYRGPKAPADALWMHCFVPLFLLKGGPANTAALRQW